MLKTSQILVTRSKSIHKNRPRAKSRAASSVGVMYRSHDPNTGSNLRGGQIPKKKTIRTNYHRGDKKTFQEESSGYLNLIQYFLS